MTKVVTFSHYPFDVGIKILCSTPTGLKGDPFHTPAGYLAKRSYHISEYRFREVKAVASRENNYASR